MSNVIAFSGSQGVAKTNCISCASKMRLVGIEADSVDYTNEILTFECLACGKVDTTKQSIK